MMSRGLFIISYHISLLTFILADTTAPAIERTVSEGVISKGFNIVYGDEDITIVNQVVDKLEKDIINSKFKLVESIPPLPAEDVKCLMSADKYCSTHMRHMKSTLIEAIKDDCKGCSKNDKEEAGKIIASMMAHDPSAWKIFLTRLVIETMPKRNPPEPEKSRYRLIGEPTEVVSSGNRYTAPGIKVRVKRCAMEKIP